MRAKLVYTASNEGELDLCVGDLVFVTRKTKDGTLRLSTFSFISTSTFTYSIFELSGPLIQCEAMLTLYCTGWYQGTKLLMDQFLGGSKTGADAAPDAPTEEGCGWFPASYVDSIPNEQTRMKRIVCAARTYVAFLLSS